MRLPVPRPGATDRWALFDFLRAGTDTIVSAGRPNVTDISRIVERRCMQKRVSQTATTHAPIHRREVRSIASRVDLQRTGHRVETTRGVGKTSIELNRPRQPLRTPPRDKTVAKTRTA